MEESDARFRSLSLFQAPPCCLCSTHQEDPCQSTTPQCSGFLGLSGVQREGTGMHPPTAHCLGLPPQEPVHSPLGSAARTCPLPKTQGGFLALLRLFNFLHVWIPNFSCIAQPLCEATKGPIEEPALSAVPPELHRSAETCPVLGLHPVASRPLRFFFLPFTPLRASSSSPLSSSRRCLFPDSLLVGTLHMAAKHWPYAYKPWLTLCSKFWKLTQFHYTICFMYLLYSYVGISKSSKLPLLIPIWGADPPRLSSGPQPHF